MKCPYCENSDSNVVETRENHSENVTRRRRECNGCEERFTTYERVEQPSLTVVKRDGVKEPFKPDKIKRGVERACEKRPVSAEQVEDLVNMVTADVQAQGDSTIESSAIGDRVVEQLRELDEVAYVRYASVYNSFDDLDSFEEEVKTLRTDS